MAEVETVLSNEPKTWVEQKVDGVLLPATVGKTTQFDPTVDRFRDKEEIDRYDGLTHHILLILRPYP